MEVLEEKITKEEFYLLRSIIEQRFTVMDESVLNLLVERDYVSEGNGLFLTEKGQKALVPFKVKRAVFIAAGLGSRMNPITLNTPKPLINVQGKKIITTLIDAVLATGIEEIIIVRGYLKECFEVLKMDYPMIKFIDNPFFIEHNNISSSYLVRSLYENAYVFDGDLILSNQNLVHAYEYECFYLGKKVKQTDDWRLLMNGENVVGMKRGGQNCNLMIGFSFWNYENAKFFVKDIEEVYQRASGKQYYWDDVVLTLHNEHYNITCKECSDEDIIEIDTYSELVERDSRYSML